MENKNTLFLMCLHVEKIYIGVGCVRRVYAMHVQACVYNNSPQLQNLVSEENENEFLNVTNERE